MEEELNYTGHTEEILLDGKSAEELLVFVREAALALQWHLWDQQDQQMLFQTPASEQSRGELVQVGISEGSIQFHIMPVNEYYWSADQNLKVAAQLREEIARTEQSASIYQRSRHPMHREKYGALLPSKTYLITPLILYACVLVFLIMAVFGVSPLNPSAQSLFEWGGNFREAVIGGQWWRLLSYMFLHAGAMHLLMNGFALLYVGMFLEPLIGKARSVFAYLFTGIIAGLTSIMMHPSSVGVGASGAIFGLYGVFFALLTTNYLQKTARTTMMRSLLLFIVFNLLMGLQGNTDNAAHVGGLLSGMLIGYAFYPGIKAAQARK